MPAVVVASSDDADPEHPEALGIAYARGDPEARLITDPPGKSPIAWQGSQLSQIIAGVVGESGCGPNADLSGLARPDGRGGAAGASHTSPR